jgi:hypothetical protein
LIFFFEVVLELKLKSFLFESITADSLDPIDFKASLLAPLPINQRIRSHSMSVQVLAFAKITNIELYIPQLLLVIDFKVKPSSMTSCVGVTPEK